MFDEPGFHITPDPEKAGWVLRDNSRKILASFTDYRDAWSALQDALKEIEHICFSCLDPGVHDTPSGYLCTKCLAAV